jgi:hypothetical protein
MSDDPLKRARQMLQGANLQSSPPAVADRSKVDDLLARARAAVGHEADLHGKVQTASPPVPGAEKVRLEMTCAATGRSFIAIAERRGAELRLIDHELPKPGHRPGGGCGPPERLSGEYSIGYAAGWACPLCRSRERGWSCDCRERPDSFHCGGRQGRRTYCACGRLEARGFIEVESIAVRGESVGRRAQADATSSLSSRGRLALPGKR